MYLLICSDLLEQCSNWLEQSSNLLEQCSIVTLVLFLQDLLSQYHYFKNLVTSINLVPDLDSLCVADRERLNLRWQQSAQYLPSRQLQLESAISTSLQLKKEVDNFCDSVTHAELKILSGTHNKQVSYQIGQLLNRSVSK